MLSACILALLVLQPLQAAAYSWKFEEWPTECGTLRATIVGSDGQPPYRMGIVPFGGSPLSNNNEVRKILDLTFNDSTSLTFTLPYPANSQFVAVVSDNNGTGSSFGNGGATVPVNVQKGNGDSCLPSNQSSPPFTFSVPSSVTTCQDSPLSWDGSNSRGDVRFWAIIPGGNSFMIPTDRTTTVSGSPAIQWTPDIRTGVNILIVAGDDRGFGSGGSFQGSLQPGAGNTNCLRDDSPVSTAGDPAGGSYPTNNSGGTTGGGSDTNVGAIVGGVIGGLVAIALLGVLAWFLLRRKRRGTKIKEAPVDLLDAREVQPAVGREYIPEPFHVPESEREVSESSGPGSYLGINMQERRQSGYSVNTGRVSTEGSSGPRSSTTKSAAAQSGLRPVNIIQHEDAGPSSPAPQPEAETVELPPAYTNIRR